MIGEEPENTIKDRRRPRLLCRGAKESVYKDDIDYSVFCGEWCNGRIYENRSGPEYLRWFWRCILPASQERTHLEPSGDAGSGEGGVETSCK